MIFCYESAKISLSIYLIIISYKIFNNEILDSDT